MDDRSFLAEGTQFEGTLRSVGDIEIRGGIKGELSSDSSVLLCSPADVTISANELSLYRARLKGDVVVRGNVIIDGMSWLDGNVRASNVEVKGSIHGNVNTSGLLSVKSGANVTGDIKAGDLEVARGARLHGKVDMAKE